MINPAGNHFHLNRRETLRTAGAAAALAFGSGAGGLPRVAHAATPTVDASGRNATGFWPNGARLAVSFSLMFEGGGQPIPGAGSLHDRISGHAGRVRALNRFLTYAKSKEGVWFARKGEIARYVLANRAGTPVIDRGSPNVTGLPGPTA